MIFNPVISIFSLLLDLFDPFTLLKMYFTTNTRDVYRIENIVSYLYHKTDTGIISKWQINDTFIILIRIELVWDKNNWFFFLLNACFVFSFLHHLENYGHWIVLKYYTESWVYQKEKSELFGYILFLKMK